MKPLVCILDASVGVTGAIIAARREAELLADHARFMLVVPEEFDAPERETRAFERVVRLPIRSLRRTPGSALAYLPSLFRSGRALRHLLKESGCERLQVNDFFLAEAWMARRLGYAGRIVTWVRIDPVRFGGIGRMWMKAARAASDAMVVVSRYIGSRVPTTMDPTLVYDPAALVPPVEPAGQTLLFVGNYTRGKGQNVAIHAFHRLADDFPDARLVCHGGTFGLAKNDDYRRELIDLASDGPGKERIVVGDFIDDLPSAYRSALAAVNCSENESFSLTCQDASAHGLPVIATRCGGPEEIIEDGVTGLLVPVGDVGAVETAMRQLLGNPAMAKRMGGAGHVLMQTRFGEEAFVAAVCPLLALG